MFHILEWEGRNIFSWPSRPLSKKISYILSLMFEKKVLSLKRKKDSITVLFEGEIKPFLFFLKKDDFLD